VRANFKDGALCVDPEWRSLFAMAIREAGEECRKKGDDASAQILERIVTTIEEVPPLILWAYAEMWATYEEGLEQGKEAGYGGAIRIEAALLNNIAQLNPRNATEYISEVLRRCGQSVLE
jgi:hypothetical protein